MPAGTAMLLRVMVEQLALFLIAVAASVKVQEARSLTIGLATTAHAKAPSRRVAEIISKIKRSDARYNRCSQECKERAGEEGKTSVWTTSSLNNRDDLGALSSNTIAMDVPR